MDVCERLADTLLSPRRCLAKALSLSKGIFPDSRLRLRTQEDPSQAKCGDRSVLCSASCRRRQTPWATRDLQQAHRKCPELRYSGVTQMWVWKIGLIWTNRLQGPKDIISAVFPSTPQQRCTMPLKRNLLCCESNDDKGELAYLFRHIFNKSHVPEVLPKRQETDVTQKAGGVSPPLFQPCSFKSIYT